MSFCRCKCGEKERCLKGFWLGLMRNETQDDKVKAQKSSTIFIEMKSTGWGRKKAHRQEYLVR